MTDIITAIAPNGDNIEIHNHPGCEPILYINGVLQDQSIFSRYKVKVKDYGKWEEWFAWRPVRVRGERIWWKKIYRRVSPHSTYANIMSGSSVVEYEYGTIFDVIRGK